MKRREWLIGSAAALASAPFLSSDVWADAAPLSPRFDYAWLKGQARAMAAKPYDATSQTPAPASLTALNWDEYQSIKFRPDHALWANDKLPFRVQFFHLGLNYGKAVRIHEVVDGTAREISYDPAAFDLSRLKNVGPLPKNLGFAGFRINFHTDFVRDVAAFLGASYFRAVGGELQYGLSARGLAIDCGMQRPEEIPGFHRVLDRTAETRFRCVDGVCAARFTERCRRVPLRYPARRDIDDAHRCRTVSARRNRTSRHRADDEHVLCRAKTIIASPTIGARRFTIRTGWRCSTATANGSGVRSRIRRRRASIRISTKIRTVSDCCNATGTSIITRTTARSTTCVRVCGSSRCPASAKAACSCSNFPRTTKRTTTSRPSGIPRRSRNADKNCCTRIGCTGDRRCRRIRRLPTQQMTWTGIGGMVGWKHDYFSWRFVVDFAGGDLASLPHDAKVEPIVTASSGTLELLSARPLASIRGYRAMFDVRPADDRPVDLRLFLRSDGRALTETWTYQWTPPRKP